MRPEQFQNLFDIIIIEDYLVIILSKNLEITQNVI